MFTILQIPICDIRPHISPSYRVNSPPWPNVSDIKYFVRFYGKVQKRANRSYRDWTGEDFFCDASRAIKAIDFSKLDDFKYGDYIRFKRLYVSKEGASRIEIGFSNNLETWDVSDEERNNAIVDTLVRYLELSVKINKREQSEFTISNCGNSLADLYLKASTKEYSVNRNKLQDWWVKAGDPILYVELFENETNGSNSSINKLIGALPSYTKLFDELKQNHITLAHFHLLINKKITKVWLVHFTDRKYFDYVRRLRINLLNLHKELEYLKMVLGCIVEQGMEISEELKNYLEKIGEKIFRRKRYGFDNGKILELAINCEYEVNEGAWETLEEELKEISYLFKKSIRNSFFSTIPTQNPSTTIINIDHIGQFATSGVNMIKQNNLKDVTVYGDLNFDIGGNVTHIENSAATEDLKRYLVQLNSEIAKIVKSENIPADDAQEIARDLKTVTEEFASKKPRANVAKSTYESIMSKIGKFAEKAEPIVKLFGTIATAVGIAL